MRQISIRNPGGFDALRLVDVAAPTASPGIVVIDVEAAGVNFADCVARLGLYAASWHYAGWPLTPGFEVAGRVSALGEGVHGLDIGQRVIAVTRFGGYAERVAVPRHQVFACPSRLTPPQAAGIAVVFLTAAYALDELAAPRPGSTVLVHSAAGGVGGALLQLARLRGVHTVGVVGSSHKLQAAIDAGADAVIDASGENMVRGSSPLRAGWVPGRVRCERAKFAPELAIAGANGAAGRIWGARYFAAQRKADWRIGGHDTLCAPASYWGSAARQ